MPTIPGENLVPRGSGGAAFILQPSSQSALSILQQGQRARDLAAQRAAALRAKAQEDDLKRFSTLLATAKDDTGITYQPLHMAEREQVGKDFMRIATDATLSPQAKALLLDQTKTGYEQRGLLGKQIDDTLKATSAKAAADQELNNEAVTKRLHGLQYGEDGKVLPVDQFPLRKMDDVLEDRTLYNTNKIYDNYAKGPVAPKEIYQQAVGGKPGTFSRTYSEESRFYKKNADGSLLRDPKTHKAQFDNSPALLENAMLNPRIARDLHGMMEDHQALRASATQKMAAYQPLTAEEQQAVSTDPTLMDMLGRRLSAYGYASHKEAQHYNRYPQPRAAAAAAPVDNYTPGPLLPEDTRYALPNTVDTTTVNHREAEGAISMFPKVTNYQQTTATPRADYAVYGNPVPAPMDIAKSGKKTNKHIDAWTPDEFTVMGANGKPELRTGNTQPMSGYPGELNRAFVDATTGKHIYPKTTQEGLDLVRAGKAKLRVQFDFNTEKNENFAADLKPTTDALLKQKDGMELPKYPTRELAEAAARKLLSAGTVRTTHLLSPKNAQVVEGMFGPKYRQLQAELNHENARLRAEGAAQGTRRPSFVPTKSGAAGDDRSGGMFGTTPDPTGGLYKRPRAKSDPLGFGPNPAPAGAPTADPSKRAPTKKTGVSWW